MRARTLIPDPIPGRPLSTACEHQPPCRHVAGPWAPERVGQAPLPLRLGDGHGNHKFKHYWDLQLARAAAELLNAAETLNS